MFLCLCCAQEAVHVAGRHGGQGAQRLGSAAGAQGGREKRGAINAFRFEFLDSTLRSQIDALHHGW